MSRRALFRFVTLVALLLVALFIARQLGWLDLARAPELMTRTRELGDHPAAAPAFLLIYIVATALALPGLVLTLTGGVVFGFGLGFLLNWIGATLGAMAAFALARLLGREAATAVLGHRAAAMDRIAREHGFMALLRLRLLPLIPFNVLNYGAALAGMRARPYLLATTLGIIPATAVYTYFADAVASGATEARQGAFVRAVVAGALLVLLSFLPAIARRLGSRSRRDRLPQSG